MPALHFNISCWTRWRNHPKDAKTLLPGQSVELLGQRLFSKTKYLMQAMTVALQSFDDVMVQVIDLLHIFEFVCATYDNVAGLEPTVVEQVRDAPFALVREETLYVIPDALPINGTCCRGFFGAPWLR